MALDNRGVSRWQSRLTLHRMKECATNNDTRKEQGRTEDSKNPVRER